MTDILTSEIEKREEDRFAADIFAPPTAPDLRLPESAQNVEAAESEIETRRLWSENLPRVRRAAANWDELRRGLSPVFFGEMTRRLADALNRLLDSPVQKNVEFSLDGVCEINQTENISPESGWWLTLESGGADIFLEIDDALAVRCADAALGAAENSEILAVRPLTRAEKAVLEYLALNLAFEANLCLAASQIRFRRLKREVPDALQKTLKSETFSLLVYKFRAAKNPSNDGFKIYLTTEALKSLQAFGGSQMKMSAQIIETLPEQVKNARTRFVCGSAALTYGELAALENEDVILLDVQSLSARAANFAGSTEIIFGDGDEQKIVGEPTFFAASRGSLFDEFDEKDGRTSGKISVRRVNLNSPLPMTLKSFAEFTATSFDNFMTDTNTNLINENAGDDTIAGDEQSGGLAVENLVVALRVELEARRLPLSEIAGLRENQTLELSVRPTDEVNILIDERLVGRGELVLVENERLGVRITKLMR